MSDMRFSQDSPAEDIAELLEYLKDNYDPRHTFRGQTKHYGNLIPSAYRLVMRTEDLGCPSVRIDIDRFNGSISERDEIRFRENHKLTRYYGRGLGNILAQQYGITSACLDITTDPEVAAFFATRRYPSYQHWSGAEDNPLGVIYRFSATQYAGHLVGLNLLLGLAGKSVEGIGPVWFMKYTGRRQLEDKALETILGQRKHVTNTLFTHPCIVTYKYLKDTMKEFYNEMSEKHQQSAKPSEDPFLFDKYRDLDCSRIARQQGGFIIPSVIWQCTVPKDIQILQIPKLGRHFFKPSYAIADRVLAVEDVKQSPGLQCFFFRHSGYEIDTISREYLWPPSQEDPFLQLISLAVEISNEEYLARKGCDIDDREHGILDRGYYDE